MHQIEAWQTCHELLTGPDTVLEGRLFSAQTLRAKVSDTSYATRCRGADCLQIVYDLSQLPREQLPPLRDSILSSLPFLSSPHAPTGSRAVLLQVCLALADLAIQMPEWQDPTSQMIQSYGKDPGTVGVLLGFLKSLVEEGGNSRIPLVGLSSNQWPRQLTLQNDETKRHLNSILSGSAKQVLDVLSMYIQAPGMSRVYPVRKQS